MCIYLYIGCYILVPGSPYSEPPYKLEPKTILVDKVRQNQDPWGMPGVVDADALGHRVLHFLAAHLIENLLKSE